MSAKTKAVSDQLSDTIARLRKAVFDNDSVKIQLPPSRPCLFGGLANGNKHGNDMVSRQVNQLSHLVEIETIHWAGVVSH